MVNLRGFSHMSVKACAASFNFADEDLPKEMTSTWQPSFMSRYSMSGTKSPSPVARMTVSSLGAILIASTASPTSQSAFLAPSAKIWRSFALVSMPILVNASKKAVSSPLLETEIDGAHKVLLSIVGGSMLSLWEINEAAKVVGAAAHPDANIIFGASIDPALGEEVWVTVVATGFDEPSTNVQGRLSRLREPSGEPRIERTRSLATARAGAPSYRDAGVSRGSSMRDPELPEIIPRG